MQHKQSQTGFTLIEMIVSLALFSVVITIAVGALLVLIASNRQLQNEQSVLSNLSFALDSMTREIRTGTNYYCATGSQNSGANGEKIFSSTNNATHLNMTEGITLDCEDGRDTGDYHGMAFDEGGRSVTASAATRRISYFHAPDGKLYRKVSGSAPESIVSGGIYVADAEFFVTGAEDTLIVDNEIVQPKVTIFLEAYASEQDFLDDESDGSRDFSHKIQTTITQRALDI